MNQNQFIQAFQAYLSVLEPKANIANWLYSKQKEGFLFQKGSEKYLLKVGFKAENYVPYFSVLPYNASQKEQFEYVMSAENYRFEPKRSAISWEENYKNPPFTEEELKQEMRKKGWEENPIFEVNAQEIDFNNLILNILTWAAIRKNAIYSLHLQRDIDKKIKIAETESYVAEEKPVYQRTSFPLNQILYGPSGTGKTYSTIFKSVEIADNVFFQNHKKDYFRLKKRYDELLEIGKISFVTFHQNYSYEDFVQGIKPDISAKILKFEKKEGIFKQLCNKALADTLQNFVLIIDEINRANISRVFGELITLIEDDKRWGNEYQMSVTLPSGDSFCVPKNVYILGTMNTADKSIALLDIALRRRFVFEFMPPQYENFTDEKGAIFLKSLNKEILARKGKDFLIGHSEFMKKDFDWEKVINNKIIPLLEEYFYTDKKGATAQKIIKTAIKEAGLAGDIEPDEWHNLKYHLYKIQN